MNLRNFIKNPQAYFKAGVNRLKNKMREIAYSGADVHCEMCSWKGKKFFDQKCPKCNSLPRTRLVGYALRHFKIPLNSERVIHIAPNLNEYKFMKRWLEKGTQYDRLNIREVPHINLVQDMTNTSLADNVYDLALSWHVFEHIPEDKKAISELYRIMKPGGKALISVPIYPVGNTETYEDPEIKYEDFEKVHGHYDHCRSCGLDYFRRFEAAGFNTETLMVKDVVDDDISHYGLRTDHVVWCFSK